VPENTKKKVRVRARARLAGFFLGRLGSALAIAAAVCVIAGLGLFTYYYAKYSRLVDEKLTAGPFARTSKIFAAPRTIRVGDQAAAEDLVADLRRAGYTEARANPMGYFNLRPDALEIFPGPDSYFDQNEPGVVKFHDGRISAIVSLADNTERGQFLVEPQLITNLFDRNREKRRLLIFADFPPVLIHAITSAEDKRFFQHSGFDPIRLAKATFEALREQRQARGTSTLSQQLARGFWLNPEKSWSRKAAEAIITLVIEQKLSKEQIFEYYCNQVYLGWRGGFRIHGFGEASEVVFGKDIRLLTVPEAATLAGMIQRPSVYDPFRNPQRTVERRNVILGLMRQNGHITDEELQQARASELAVARGANQSVDAPYFVDLVNETLQSMFQDIDFQSSSYRVYTTLDMDLQKAALDAVRTAMPGIDELIKKQRRFRNQQIPDPQVALVAIDPRTGQVKALIGGRNYGMSQLNRVLAKRQPGSIFKPFVFAAALETAVSGGRRIVTAGSTILDEPTTFWYDGRPYEPNNYRQQYYGKVTVRQALARSVNVPTVKLAELVGYDSVVDVARRSGLNYAINPTPSVALGAYEVTPLEIAGAYTVFANGGLALKPNFIAMVRDQNGRPIHVDNTGPQRALDARVAYLVTNLMEEVMRTGTGAGARSRGFTAPAAGKTGTSHDGWFAGYTSELICVVWVGFDDNRELNLEGAHSAMPIWTEFMKRAHEYRPYRNPLPFQAPDGIVTILIDPASGMPATPYCPATRSEVYIAGTQPVGSCPLHGAHAVTHVAGWDTTPPQLDAPPALASPRSGGAPAVALRRPLEPQRPPEAAARVEEQGEKQKKGLFRRLWGVFK
jgi:penicillin-binding protein 1B